MKTPTIVLCALFMLAWAEFHRSIVAHEDELKSETLQPRIGIMSEAVVKQKLETYGLTNIGEPKLEGNQYLIRAVYEGRSLDLEMNAQTGFLKQRGSDTGLSVAPSVRNRIINSYQIKPNRQELVKPELIRQPKPINRFNPIDFAQC
jgi:hypothetical protein